MNRVPLAGFVVVVGVLLLLGGLGSLGWSGYHYLDSTITAERSFAQETARLRERWSTEPPRPALGGRRESGLPSTTPAGAIALLRIPAFGPTFEVPILSGTDSATLSRGV